MSSPLYNQDILRLAASLAGQTRLAAAHGSADLRSPTCGSRVIVDVRLNLAGQIEALGLDARACALGQASAALMVQHATGQTAASLHEIAGQLRAFLAGEDELTEGAPFWPGIEVFAAARAYPARHPSILLAFDAAAQAAVLAQQHNQKRAGV